MKKIICALILVCFVTGMAAFADNGNMSDWAREEIDSAKQQNIIPPQFGDDFDYTKSITRSQFCDVYFLLLSVKGYDMKTAGNAFSDINSASVNALYNAGIINGKEENIFAPSDYLSREEAAVIIYRTMNFIGLAHNDMAAVFSDDDEISPWAKEAVSVVCSNGIMNGMGDGRFVPSEKYTCEQAITVCMRVLKILDNTKAVSFADSIDKKMPSDKNYMFSPLSIKMALAMAANGADGETKSQILSVLGIDDIEAYNKSVRDLTDRYSQSELIRANIANSLWLNTDMTGIDFLDEFSNTLKNIYAAQTDKVNNKNALETINGWVKEKTSGKIDSIISDTDFTAMLVNAIYFKGMWQNEFYEGDTRKDTFTDADGKKSEIDFMNQTDYFEYSQNGNCRILALPYKSKVYTQGENGEGKLISAPVNCSMYIVMSDGDFDCEGEIKKADFATNYVRLSLPKFKCEYAASLKQILQECGMTDAFDTKKADFNKMFSIKDSGIYISDVIHKTYINVDEKGTEAAAVTGIAMAGSALPPEPIDFEADKPFKYAICDTDSGEVLFMGEFSYAE